MTPDTSLLSVDQDCCRRFERAWGEGRPLPIEDCLPAADHPLFLATLEELVVIDMDFQARQGKSGAGPRLEDYLHHFPGLNEPVLLRRLIWEEVRARRRGGDVPNLQEYVVRFPTLALDTALLEQLRPHPGAAGQRWPPRRHAPRQPAARRRRSRRPTAVVPDRPSWCSRRFPRPRVEPQAPRASSEPRSRRIRAAPGNH